MPGDSYLPRAADLARMDEIGRILVRCELRDRMAVGEARAVALLLRRASDWEGESPRVAVLLRQVAEEVRDGS